MARLIKFQKYNAYEGFYVKNDNNCEMKKTKLNEKCDNDDDDDDVDAIAMQKNYVNLTTSEYVNLQMTSSGIPGVTMDAVSYVQKALLPGQTNPEAAATFARMIESSLKSWFTQFNFFLHNLAQLRFSGEQNDGELLSFIPRTYT